MSWTMARLGDVSEIVSGSTPKTDIPEYWGGDIPWVTPADLSKLDGHFIGDTPRKLTTSGLRNSGARMLPIGSVLFSSRAPIGHVAITSVPMSTNQGFKSLVPEAARLDSKYLFWWLRANKSYLQGLGVGATFKEVSKTIVSEVRLPLPPLAEQLRIAAILDRADDLRAKRRRAVELLDELANQLFLDMFGDVVANNRGWPTGRVSDIVSGFSSGKSLATVADNGSEGFNRVLKVSAVTSGTFKPLEAKPLPRTYVPPASHFVSHGDLLISRANTSELVGATAYVRQSPTSLVLSDKLWRFEWPSNRRPAPIFVWQMFSRPEFRKLISDRATGTSGSMKNISQSTVLGLPVIMPPADAQAEFCRSFERIECARMLHGAHLVYLDELVASLQNRAFIGEL